MLAHEKRARPEPLRTLTDSHPEEKKCKMSTTEMGWSEKEGGTQEGMGKGGFQGPSVGTSNSPCKVRVTSAKGRVTNTSLYIYCSLHCTKLVKHQVT